MMLKINVLDLFRSVVFREKILNVRAVNEFIFLRSDEKPGASLNAIHHLRYLEILDADARFLLDLLTNVGNQTVE